MHAAISPQRFIQPLHILLIEDDEGDRDLALAYLTEDANQLYQVTWAASLQAGLDQLASTTFDAVILDLILPDSRGVATVQKLCRHTQGIPVIVSSYFDEDALANKVIELGAQDYLAKDQMDSKTLGRSLTRSLSRAKHHIAQLGSSHQTQAKPAQTESAQASQQLTNARVNQLRADISKLEAIASDINQTATKEQALEEMRQRTVTTLSHECRSPATVLLLATNILKNYTPQIEDPQYLSTLIRIEEAVNQLMKLLDNARIFKQTQTLSATAKPESFNLEQLCQDVIATVQKTEIQKTESQKTESQKTTFSTSSHPPTLPSSPRITATYTGKCHNIYHHKTVIQHILQQLLTNAVIYSPESTPVTLSVVCHNQQLILKIQDQGCGIPIAEQSQIFEAFYRSSYVDNIHGLGLGLTIVQTCVNMCSGQITLSSQQNKGTTVTVTLPELQSIA